MDTKGSEYISTGSVRVVIRVCPLRAGMTASPKKHRRNTLCTIINLIEKEVNLCLIRLIWNFNVVHVVHVLSVAHVSYVGLSYQKRNYF
jgi:hypothetical protein